MTSVMAVAERGSPVRESRDQVLSNLRCARSGIPRGTRQKRVASARRDATRTPSSPEGESLCPGPAHSYSYHPWRDALRRRACTCLRRPVRPRPGGGHNELSDRLGSFRGFLDLSYHCVVHAHHSVTRNRVSQSQRYVTPSHLSCCNLS